MDVPVRDLGNVGLGAAIGVAVCALMIATALISPWVRPD